MEAGGALTVLGLAVLGLAWAGPAAQHALADPLHPPSAGHLLALHPPGTSAMTPERISTERLPPEHLPPNTLWAADPALEKTLAKALNRHFPRGRVGLVVRAADSGRVLARLRDQDAFIPASNAKLITTYGALNILGPDARWETRFRLVRPQNGPGGGGGQALLVTGEGDPTLDYPALVEIAHQLKAKGVTRLEGFRLDAGRFAPLGPAQGWGQTAGDQPWFAPIHPFILDGNIGSFQVTLPGDWVQHPESVRVTATRLSPPLVFIPHFAPSDGKPSYLAATQGTGPEGLTFHLNGRVPQQNGSFRVENALVDPAAYFALSLAAALTVEGVEVNPRMAPADGSEKFLGLEVTHRSPPLRQVVAFINKESNNLGAETLLRRMGQDPQGRQTPERGLEALERWLKAAFPGQAGGTVLVDGSGLDRGSITTPELLGALLLKVWGDTSLQPEFLASLPLAGWDGTLAQRGFPQALEGKVRAKTGTLKGVCNLSGYLHLERQAVVFSFLVNDDPRNYLDCQQAQDAVTTELYGELLKMERAGNLR